LGRDPWPGNPLTWAALRAAHSLDESHLEGRVAIGGFFELIRLGEGRELEIPTRPNPAHTVPFPTRTVAFTARGFGGGPIGSRHRRLMGGRGRGIQPGGWALAQRTPPPSRGGVELGGRTLAGGGGRISPAGPTGKTAEIRGPFFCVGLRALSTASIQGAAGRPMPSSTSSGASPAGC